MFGHENPLRAIEKLGNNVERVRRYCEDHGFKIHDGIEHAGFSAQEGRIVAMFDESGRKVGWNGSGDPCLSTLYLMGDSIVIQFPDNFHYNVITDGLVGDRERQHREYVQNIEIISRTMALRRQGARDSATLGQLGGEAAAILFGRMEGRFDTIQMMLMDLTQSVDEMRRNQRRFENFVALALQHLDNRITETQQQQAAIGMMLLEEIAGVAEEVHNQESVEFVHQIEGLSSYTDGKETIASQIGHTVSMRYHGGRPDGRLVQDLTNQILSAPLQISTSASMPSRRRR